MFDVLYHHAKFDGARLSGTAGADKSVEFFVRLSVCLLACSSHCWTSEFVRSISPWMCWNTETILMLLNREFVCASVFNFQGLEKRLGLCLARSRSRLVAKIRRLGLVELQEGLGLISDQKPNVSVSLAKVSFTSLPYTMHYAYSTNIRQWQNSDWGKVRVFSWHPASSVPL